MMSLWFRAHGGGSAWKFEPVFQGRTDSSLFYSFSQALSVSELRKSFGPWPSTRTRACPPLREKLLGERYYGLGMDALGDLMLLEHARNYGLGMDAVVHSIPSQHERNHGLGVDLQHARNDGLGMDALVTVCSRNTCGIMVWAWMLWFTVYPRNTNGIMVWAWICNTHGMMVWAWMPWWPYAVGTRAE